MTLKQEHHRKFRKRTRENTQNLELGTVKREKTKIIQNWAQKPGKMREFGIGLNFVRNAALHRLYRTELQNAFDIGQRNQGAYINMGT